MLCGSEVCISRSRVDARGGLCLGVSMWGFKFQRSGMGITANAAVLDVSQTTKLGNDVIYSNVCSFFEDGYVGRCSANNTIVNWKLPAQNYGGEGREDCQGEEDHRP